MQQEPFILPEKAIVRDPQGNVFVIEGVLGKGEFGAVYLVRERGKLHTIFALKEVINPDKGARERFAFEGEILKRLHHTSLPRVYRVFENDGLKRVYLLMDYIHGQNLEVLRLKQSGQLLFFAPGTGLHGSHCGCASVFARAKPTYRASRYQTCQYNHTYGWRVERC